MVPRGKAKNIRGRHPVLMREKPQEHAGVVATMKDSRVNGILTKGQGEKIQRMGKSKTQRRTE